jgi:hypothetical protein
MSSKIEIKRLTLDTIFRLLFIGFLFSLVPFFIIFGVLSLFGIGGTSFTFDNQVISGIPALIYSPFIGLFITLIFTAIFGIFISFGLWLFSKLKPFPVRYISLSNRHD